MRKLAIVLALAGWTLSAGAQTPEPSAANLASRVQAHYSTVRDFTAGFSLSSTSPLTVKPLTDRGALRVKKPGRMRWTFETNERQQFIADGLQLYSYFPRDRYVMVTALPKGDDVSTAMLFLTGRGNLVRDFKPAIATGARPGEWRLVLTPLTRQTDFETLTVEVVRDTFALTGLIVADLQGGTATYRFTNLRENVGLTDREFDFAIPKGVEVKR